MELNHRELAHLAVLLAYATDQEVEMGSGQVSVPTPDEAHQIARLVLHGLTVEQLTNMVLARHPGPLTAGNRATPAEVGRLRDIEHAARRVIDRIALAQVGSLARDTLTNLAFALGTKAKP